MKTRFLKNDGLILLLGIALIVGGLVATTTYYDLERRTQADEALMATTERMIQALELSAALKRIHNGEVDAAAQRLDLLLCGDILRTDSELASADAPTRLIVEDAFRRIALLRPKTSGGLSAKSAKECGDDRVAAEMILGTALARNHTAQPK